MAVVLRFDKNKHGRGVTCYVRDDLSFKKRNHFPHETEIIFTEKFLPKINHMKSWYNLSSTHSNKTFRNNE